MPISNARVYIYKCRKDSRHLSFYFTSRLLNYVYQSINLLAVVIALVLIDAEDLTVLLKAVGVEPPGSFVMVPK